MFYRVNWSLTPKLFHQELKLLQITYTGRVLSLVYTLMPGRINFPALVLEVRNYTLNDSLIVLRAKEFCDDVSTILNLPSCNSIGLSLVKFARDHYFMKKMMRNCLLHGLVSVSLRSVLKVFILTACIC